MPEEEEERVTKGLVSQDLPGLGGRSMSNPLLTSGRRRRSPAASPQFECEWGGVTTCE